MWTEPCTPGAALVASQAATRKREWARATGWSKHLWTPGVPARVFSRPPPGHGPPSTLEHLVLILRIMQLHSSVKQPFELQPGFDFNFTL